MELNFILFRAPVYSSSTKMATLSSTSNDGPLSKNGSENGSEEPNDVQNNGQKGITHLMERSQISGNSGCIEDSELSAIGSGVGPNDLQKIAVRYLKVPQPAIDTYKASARYDKFMRV